MRALEQCYSVEDLRLLAKRRLPKGIFEYIDLGTEDHVALKKNREAFESLRLRTRFLVDLTETDWSTTVFDRRSALPFGIGPTGIGGLCWPNGDYWAAKAAASAGIPFTLASPAITPMEQVAKAGGRLWYQVYLWEEQDLSYEVIAKARDLGFEALVVTVDSALGRLREHNERNGFAFPFRPNRRAMADMIRHPKWLTSVLFRSIVQNGLPVNANYPPKYQRVITRRGTPKPQRFVGMQWRDIERIRQFWPGTLIVKSVLSGSDAEQAVNHGADGIVVSNHGGRTMDSAVSSIDALPEVVAAVGGATTVLFDSGIRRGSDIIKALALGADMVLLGRASLYGLASGGEDGIAKAINILADEFEKTMGYIGCRTISELSPEIFAPGRLAS